MVTGEIFKNLSTQKENEDLPESRHTELIIYLWFSVHICISLNLQIQVGRKCYIIFPLVSVRSSPRPHPIPPPNYSPEMVQVSAAGPHPSSPRAMLVRWEDGWGTSRP